MTGPGTLEFRDDMGPMVLEMLTDFGQQVTILRPGAAPLFVRAFLYQQDDRPAAQRNIEADFKVRAWQGLFLPDAPIRERGFVVQDAQGRLFWPDGDVQDAGEQGVALIASLLPLPERTRTEFLTFQVEGQLTEDPVTGNWEPGPGQPLHVPVRLSATVDPKVREMVGADVAEVAFVGRWGDLLTPLSKPPGVFWGSASPLTVDGQPGQLTLKLAYPDPDSAQELVLGSRFIALWKAGIL